MWRHLYLPISGIYIFPVPCLFAKFIMFQYQQSSRELFACWYRTSEFLSCSFGDCMYKKVNPVAKKGEKTISFFPENKSQQETFTKDWVYKVKLRLTLLSATFYQVFIFHQTIALKKLWKMSFISSKKLFSFRRYSNFCISVFPFFFSLSVLASEVDPR